MKNQINSLSRFCYKPALGLVLIRVSIGLLFLIHGWMKVENMSRTIMMFADMGFPHWTGYCIAWLELIGGAALILGVLTRVFAVLFGVEMLVAVLLMGIGRSIGGVELLLSLASFGLALTGSGRYSLWAMECRNCAGMLCSGNSSDCVPE